MGVLEIVWVLRLTGYVVGGGLNAFLFFGCTDSSEWSSQSGQFPIGRVAHAGGVELLESQANTRYAVQKSHSQGFRLIELDFMQTSDGVWVCQYYWEDEAPAYQRFSAMNNARPYPFCDLEWLVKWRSAKQDLYLVLDTKQENALELAKSVSAVISNDSDELRYWIPQAYSLDDVMRLRAQGFPNIVYTLYKLHDRDVALRDAQNLHRTTGLAFTVPSGAQNRRYGRALAEMGFPVFYHTVNNEDVFQLLREEGGAVNVYTDLLLPD